MAFKVKVLIDGTAYKVVEYHLIGGQDTDKTKKPAGM